MAGNSQIIINEDGITFITPNVAEFRAGQHVFKSGEKVDFKIPILPFYAGNPLCPLKSRFGKILFLKIND